MMRVLYGYCGFNSTGQRNSVQNRITTEATNRNLTPYTFNVGDGYGIATGVERITVEGAPGLKLAYSGSDADVLQAENDIYQYMQANGLDIGGFGSNSLDP